eukprot:TRINITY_DN1688_c8_g1_i1.p1 TRINITY_DN1688_c8_g1~~TRINITY_DN1688_c8_g1_i1.p1  ORF type:complete len:899 (+),score=278.83 TRINITY_DN1688_c8_g1_i1:51-2699(+)
MKQSVMLLALVAAVHGQNVNSDGCVTDAFSSTVDVLPHKTDAVGGESWGIKYSNWYKRLNVSYLDGGVKKERVYQLVQCYADAAQNTAAVAALPACTPPGCNRITIPVKTVGVGPDTRIIGMLESLNLLSTITYVTDNVASPCLQSKTTTPADPNNAAQVANVDAYFVNTIPTADNAKFVKVGVIDEVMPEFKANWLEYIALFYNREADANYIGETTKVVYDAQSHSIQQLSTTKNIAWITGITDTTITFTNSLYMKYLIEAAHATAINFATTASTANGAHLTVLKTVDAIVIEDDTNLTKEQWLSRLGVPAGATGYNFIKGTEPVIYLLRKYSNSNGQASDFNEHAAVAPDLILSDLIKISHDVAPWSSVQTIFLRLYSQSLTIIAASADVCGKGLYRPFAISEIRRAVLSRLKTVPNPQRAVLDFQQYTDYFATKIDPTHAKDYTVEYHLTWKLVRNLRAKEDYILLLKGCPDTSYPSVHVLPSAKRFSIPLDGIALSGTIDVTYIEQLGLIDLVKKSTTAPSPCMQKGLEDGIVLPLSWSFTAADVAGIDMVTKFGADASLPTSVAITASADEGPLNRAEWLRFYAAFFNREAEAATVFGSIREKYLCVTQKGAQAAQALGRKPQFMMITKSFSGSSWEATTHVVWKMAAEAAGGVLASTDPTSSASTGGSGFNSVKYSTQAELFAAFRDVDVVVDTTYFGTSNASHPVELADTLATYGLTETSDFKFIKNKAWFRVDKRMDDGGFIDWFGRAVVEADAVVEDFITMMHPGWTSNTHLHFGRDLFKGTAVELMAPEGCDNYYGNLVPLTQATDRCSIPCAERNHKDYCDSGCLWVNNACQNIPITPVPTPPPIIVYVGASGATLPSLVLTVVAAVFMLL